MLKNWSSINSAIIEVNQGRLWSALVFLFLGFKLIAQVNLVPNPSFESYTTCPTNVLGNNFTLNWKSLDSINSTDCSFEYYNVCAGNIPHNPSRYYQNPRTGKGMVLLLMYLNGSFTNYRTPMRVKLKQTLTACSVYCAKMHVNLAEQCRFAIDGFGMYFDNGVLDTVQDCGRVVNFVTPQVSNPLTNIINDTLNWIPISGTFTANGSEIYLTISNFLSETQTSTVITNPSFPIDLSEYLIDDVSVIDFNISAYAGPDKNIFLGDSVFIGRPPEIGLDCTWTTGTVTVGDSAGIWVKPTTPGTYSYVVTQNICGNIKTDTVIVNVSPSSINENTFFANSISLYPQPAKDVLNISLSNYYEPTIQVKIVDVNGRIVKSEDLSVKQGKAQLNTYELNNGVYIIQLKNSAHQMAMKKLIISD